MLIKQKSLSLLRNVAPGTFSKLLSVLNKGKSAIPPLFKGPEVLSSVSDEAKLFAKNFLRTLILISQVCLKESCFPDCWKVSSVIPAFMNVGERSTAKNYHPVRLLSVISKVFEKLLITC